MAEEFLVLGQKAAGQMPSRPDGGLALPPMARIFGKVWPMALMSVAGNFGAIYRPSPISSARISHGPKVSVLLIIPDGTVPSF